MVAFVLHSLPELGRALQPDTDHVLARVRASHLLLINLVPGSYEFESHECREYLLCLRGTLVLEDETGTQVAAQAGEMIEIPPQLRHRFAPTSEAVIMTVAQNG